MDAKVWILHDITVKRKRNQIHVISTFHDVKTFGKRVMEFWETMESR